MTATETSTQNAKLGHVSNLVTLPRDVYPQKKTELADLLKYARNVFLNSESTCSETELEDSNWNHDTSIRILKRNNEGYKTEKKGDLWKQKYQRRQYNLQIGFFTPISEPYHTFGEHILPHEEILHIVAGEPSDEQKAVTQNKFTSTTKQQDKNAEKNNQQSKKKPPAGILTQALKTVGMSEIRERLQCSRQRIIAVQGGQCYLEHLKKSKKPDPVVEESYGMSLSQISSHSLNPLFQQEKQKDRSKEPSKRDPPSNTNKLIIVNQPGDNWKTQKKIQQYYEKLDWLYVILCSLYNMKMRVLKMKTPLTAVTIANIRNEVINLKDARATQLGLDRPNNHGGRMMSMASTAIQASSMVQPSQRMSFISSSTGNNQKKPSLLTPEYSSNDQTRPSIYRKMWSNRHQRSSRKSSEMNTSPMLGHKVDTWDDLLHYGSGNKTRARKLTPWQQIVQADKERPVMQPKTEAEKAVEAETEGGSALQVWHKQMHSLKEGALHNLQERLETHDRECPVKFRYQLRALHHMDPLWTRQREYLTRAAQEATRDPVLILHTTVKWFDKIFAEGTELSCQDRPEIAAALSKLEKFMNEDISKMPYVKAKLCLLVLSLPAYEICLLPLQAALIYILTEALELEPSLLDQWLLLRSLHVVS